jgi:hypothetical protein
MRESQEQARVIIKEHFESIGVPEDSIVFKMAELQIACNLNPELMSEVVRLYPDPIALRS